MGQEDQDKKSENLSAAPPSVSDQFAELAAEVNKDILNLRDEGIKLNPNDKQAGTELFNQSYAVRKLIVFLATANMEKLHGMMSVTSSLDVREVLLSIALDPLSMGNTHFVKNIEFKTKTIGFENEEIAERDENKKIVFYDKRGTMSSGTSLARATSVKSISKILLSVVKAVGLVTNKKKELKSSLEKKVVGVDKKSLRQYIKNALAAFVDLFCFGKKKQKPLKLTSNQKEEGAKILSDFFKNKKETGNRTDGNQNKDDVTLGG